MQAGCFTADPASGKPPYSIVLPRRTSPEACTWGTRSTTPLMDALTRRKRMQGYEVLWLPGMDHAGIATQTLVEKQLGAEGVQGRPGPERFIEKVWGVEAHLRGTIGAQMRRLGDGVDWSRDRFTMDEGCPGRSGPSSNGL